MKKYNFVHKGEKKNSRFNRFNFIEGLEDEKQFDEKFVLKQKDISMIIEIFIMIWKKKNMRMMMILMKLINVMKTNNSMMIIVKIVVILIII